MSDIELAWAAGFFDGEGCSHAALQRYQRYDMYRPVLSVHQVELEPLERFHRAVGGLGVINGPYKHGQGRPIYKWSASGPKTFTLVMDRLVTYLSGPKTKQAEGVWQKYQDALVQRDSVRKPSHCRLGHEYTPENTYLTKSRGARVCRECKKTYWRESWRSRHPGRQRRVA